MTHKRFKIEETAQKSNKIEFLRRQVKRASTQVAMANAKYESCLAKANVFMDLYAEAESNRTAAINYWELFLKVKSSLDTGRQTSDVSKLKAVNIQHEAEQLIIHWQKVTKDTIKAAKAIQLSADYIQKKKAVNPLISNDLVSDAVAASKKAEKAVEVVIDALTDSLTTLSSSTGAKNDTELTNVYIDRMVSILLEKGQGFDESLEASLKKGLEEAKQHAAQALLATENANKEMNIAKDELSQATAALATWEAALAAAETAVAG